MGDLDTNMQSSKTNKDMERMARDDDNRRQPCCDKLRTDGLWQELKITFKFGLGTMMAHMSQMMIQPVTTMFGGHLGKIELDAVALANSIINIFGSSIAIGMGTGADTYFAQAFGHKEYRLVRIILQRTLILQMLLLLLCCCIFVNIEAFLLLAGQDKEVSRLCQQYIYIFLPGMLCIFLYTVLRKYFSCQNMVNPFIIIGWTGIALCALLQYICLYVLHLGVKGSAIAQNLTWLAMLCMAIGYMFISGEHKQVFANFSYECLEEWGPFVKLGFYGIVMICLEWWCLEISLFLAGLLGTTQLGAQGVILNLLLALIAIIIGMADATIIRVGQALGAGQPMAAVRASRAGYCISVIIASVIAVCFITLNQYLPLVFTSERDVVDLCAEILPYLAIYTILDGITFLSRAILRGAGKQALATVLIILAYYVCAMPIGASLMFLTPLGIFGSWVGFICGLVVLSIVYLIYTLAIMDYPKLAKEAQGRVTGICESVHITGDEDEHTNLISAKEDQVSGTKHSLENGYGAMASRNRKSMRGALSRRTLIMKRTVTVLSVVLIFIVAVITGLTTQPLLDIINSSHNNTNMSFTD